MTKLEELTDSGILNLEFENEDYKVFSFFAEWNDGFYWGGFLIDKELNVIRGICNSLDKKSNEMAPVQLIVKSDNLKIDDFVAYSGKNEIQIVIPRIWDMKNVLSWKELITEFNEKKRISVGNFVAVCRFSISDRFYIQHIINEANIEKQLSTQLRCAQIIKRGLDNVADGLHNTAHAISRGSVFIGESIDNGAWGLPSSQW